MYMLGANSSVEMVGAKSRRHWRECEKDMELLGLKPEWIIFRDLWRGTYNV